MSNIHTLSSIKSSTSPNSIKKNAAAGTQIGSTVYRTTNAGYSLLNTAQGQVGNSKIATLSNRSSIASKLSHSFMGGKDTEYDKQLASAARQKQRVDLPMSPEVRMESYDQRETIKPEREMMCPNGHKIPAAQAKKQLSSKDVYMCQEKVGDATCDALCGGADVHPLHLEIRHLHVKDKNRYVDSVRWLSRSEVEVQTREYIKGHPLVFPHLAVEVLFHDETDAWLGYILGWNIYYWFSDIHKYFATARKSLEEKTRDEDGEVDEDEVERGRGKRRKRKIAAEHLQVEAEDEEAEWEQFDEAAFEAAAEKATGTGTSNAPAAAAAASTASASSSSSAPQPNTQSVEHESNARSEKKAKITPHASPAKPLSTGIMVASTSVATTAAPHTSATATAIANPFTVAPQHEVIELE